TIRLCADGGANRLHDRLADDAARSQLLPDLILGDLDSIRPDVRAFYESRGVPVTSDGDQDSTDFGKCVAHVRSLEGGGAPPSVVHDHAAAPSADDDVRRRTMHELIVLGALGGRLDQTMHSIHMLYKMEIERKVHLVSNESVAVLLRGPGVRHRVRCRRSHDGPTCGLLPIGVEEAKVVTKGLKWDLDGSRISSFKSLVSSSNAFADAEGDVADVLITTDKPIVWTVECSLGP
ncbi:hypothetical protein HK101_006003, partial [Irineochytrium annulatum]